MSYHRRLIFLSRATGYPPYAIGSCGQKEGGSVNDVVKYVVYFLLGGTIVSISTYLGSQGKSFLAAFASTFPAITGATFVLMYLNGGSDAIVSYAKNLLWFVPPWIVYVLSMIAGVPRFGFWPTMAGALVLYMGSVGAVRLWLR
jgi:hypothetical protein